MRSRLTYANVVSSVCLFIVLGGSAYAAATITGSDVENGSLTGADVKTNSLKGADIQGIRGVDINVDAVDSDEIKDHSIRAFDLADDALAGIKGDKGDTGPAGPAGANGKDGKDGRDGIDGEDATGGSGLSTLVVRSNSGVSPGRATVGQAPRLAFAVSCLAGERATGGSAVSSESPQAVASRPSPPTAGQPPNGWESLGGPEQSYNDETITVYVVCAS